MYLGIDTSNYTTSAAICDGVFWRNVSRLLDVRQGELGLRQSDALFQHVKRLPAIMEELLKDRERAEICAVAASTRPRTVAGSYMPCFLAGESVGRSVAASLGVPFYAVSHQQGHIAAVLYSAGKTALMDSPLLAWHLSGGTTELLLVMPEDKLFRVERIGGTSDISAGQVIDRAGKLLGVPFPAGKELESLAADCVDTDRFRVRLDGLSFSFSGLENKVRDHATSHRPSAVASYCLRSVADAVVRATEAAVLRYPGLPVVFSGGVASNSILRSECAKFDPIFAEPRCSTDNALGVAVLCQRCGG